MMIDKETEFSNKQALADGATSTNIVDVGPCDLGQGNAVTLYVSVQGASGDLVVSLSASDKADMSAPTEPANYEAPADMVAAGGVVVKSRLPAGCKRYLRLTYTGASGGTVSAGLVKDA